MYKYLLNKIQLERQTFCGCHDKGKIQLIASHHVSKMIWCRIKCCYKYTNFIICKFCKENCFDLEKILYINIRVLSRSDICTTKKKYIYKPSNTLQMLDKCTSLFEDKNLLFAFYTFFFVQKECDMNTKKILCSWNFKGQRTLRRMYLSYGTTLVIWRSF